MKSDFCCVFFITLLFIILSLPQTYQLTNKVLPTFNKTPTYLGIIIHSIVFAIIIIVTKYLKREKFVNCKEGDYSMKSDIDKKYIDLTNIKSPYSEMGIRGTKWPYDKRYIPQTDKRWCLKKSELLQ
mgnify:CR=1 FL=1